MRNAEVKAEAQDPKARQPASVAVEHLVLRTDVGDLLIALYQREAPQTVAQILRLARAGVFDGVRIYRVEPGFVAQLSSAQDRLHSLAPAQTGLIKKIPAEFSSIPHERGVLSMAREDADPNSAETSFSLLLGAAPHLDGKYTVFGRVEKGFDVLDALERVAVDPATHIPLARLGINRAEVVTNIETVGLGVAHPQAATATTGQAGNPVGIGPGLGASELTAGLGIILLLALVIAFGRQRLGERTQSSLAMLIVLVGGVLTYGLALPATQASELAGGFIFLGLLAMFRLMSAFEGG